MIEQVGVYWAKFQPRQIQQATEGIPHGILYRLTLHDRYGKRIMGFDNAHAIRIGTRNKNGHHNKAYDHYHRYENDEGIPYRFINAYQLLEDFWLAVDKTLSMLGLEEK